MSSATRTTRSKSSKSTCGASSSNSNSTMNKKKNALLKNHPWKEQRAFTNAEDDDIFSTNNPAPGATGDFLSEILQGDNSKDNTKKSSRMTPRHTRTTTAQPIKKDPPRKEQDENDVGGGASEQLPPQQVREQEGPSSRPAGAKPTANKGTDLEAGHEEPSSTASPTTSTTTKAGKARKQQNFQVDQDQWDKRFQELVTYKQTNGHCNVKQKDGKLGKWVDNQRRTYKSVLNGGFLNGRHLSGNNLQNYIKRMEQLEEVGFQWDLGRRSSNSWHDKYEALQLFKTNHGHVRIKKRDGELGRWADNQRRRLPDLVQQNPQPLYIERHRKLEELGFEWTIRPNASKKQKAQK